MGTVLSTVVAGLLTSGPPCNVAKFEAETLRMQADQAFKEARDFHRALQHLQALAGLFSTGCDLGHITPARVMWQIGRAHEELGQVAKAVEAFQQHRSLSEAPEERARSQEKLAQMTGTLDLRCNAQGEAFLGDDPRPHPCPSKIPELLPGDVFVLARSIDGIERALETPVIAGKTLPVVIEFMGLVELRGLPAGARVAVDAVPRLESTFTVPSGSRFLQVDSPGFHRWERPVEVEPGRRSLIDFEGVPLARRETGVSPWITLGAATVLLAGSGVAFGLTLDRYGEAEGLDRITEADQRNALIDEGTTWQIVGGSALAGSVLAMVAAWYFWPDEAPGSGVSVGPGGVWGVW